MRRRRSVYLLGLAAPLMLLQTQPLGCLLSSGGSGAASSGAPAFNLPPTVVLVADVQRGIAPLTVQFSSTGSTDNGVIVERLWDFGDATTSPEISPTHKYIQTGTFTVTLTLTDDLNASASRSTTISVTQQPVARFSVTFSGVQGLTFAETSPATFSFDGSASYDPDATEGEVLQYTWDFGDGSRELLPVVDHTFATPGTYRVRLTVTDAVGVTGFEEQLIEVGIPHPTITFRAPPESIASLVCSADSPLWVHAVYDVEPGVARRLRAGFDGDRDICEAQTVTYDSATGTELRRLFDANTREGPVTAAAFSPDGTKVLIGGLDGVVRRYEAATGTLLFPYYPWDGSAALCLAWAPDGKSFVAGYRNGTLVQRQLDANGNVTRTTGFAGHTGAVNSVAASPDGTQVLAGDSSGKAILWNVSDGSVAFRYDHGGVVVSSAAFSPTDPSRIATGSADQYARVWSTVNGRLVQQLGPVYNNGELVAGHGGAVNAVAFSADGTQLVTGSSDKRAKIWNLSTGQDDRTFTGHTDAVLAVALSPDGKQLMTGSADGTAVLWDAVLKTVQRTLKPCASPIGAVGYTRDGKTVLAGIAAYNDIQLDTEPAQGADLNLTQPTALQLDQVPVASEGSRYYLWVEVETDRTAPSRTYASTRISMIPPFGSGIGDSAVTAPPRIENYFAREVDASTGKATDMASVLTPASRSRQIVSLGQLFRGDRLFLSLLSVPGYGQVYTQSGLNPLSAADTQTTGAADGFSVLMLDSDQYMYAWYDVRRALFTPASKLVVGHDSADYYIVLDATGSELTPGVNVRVVRDFSATSEPRTQHVHLKFEGERGVAVANCNPFNVAPFAMPAPWDTNNVRNAIVARVTDQLKNHNFAVSETEPASSTTPRLTIYFDAREKLLQAAIPDRNGDNILDVNDLYLWGLPDYLDPRNETLSGRAIVAVGDIVVDPRFVGLADGQMGLAIGNSVLHQVGLMCGLRETTQAVPDDLMTDDLSQVASPVLGFSIAPLAALADLDPIGIQNGPQLLREIFGDK